MVHVIEFLSGGEELVSGPEIARYVFQLNSPVSLSVSVTNVPPEIVDRANCEVGKFANVKFAGEIVGVIRIDRFNRQEANDSYSLRGTCIESIPEEVSLPFSNLDFSHHLAEETATLSVVFQDPHLGGFELLNRIFDNAIMPLTASDFGYLANLLPKHSTIVRSGDISNIDFFTRLTGFLRHRAARVLGWNQFQILDHNHVPTPKAYLDWVIAPNAIHAAGRGPYDDVKEFRRDGWIANPQAPETLQGAYWMATNICKYIRTGTDHDFPELMRVLNGSYDPREDNFRNLLPGCYRIGRQLFICLRVDVSYVRSQPMGLQIVSPSDHIEVSAYFAPIENVYFAYPSLSESELRLPFNLDGWSEDGLMLRIRPDKSTSWVLGSKGTEKVDMDGHLLAELHSPFPPDEERAGMYVTPRPQMNYRVRIRNGSIPEIHGGVTYRVEQLEKRDLSLNAKTAIIVCGGARTELSEQHGLDVSSAITTVHATAKVQVKSDLDVTDNATIKGEELKLFGNLKIASN